MPRIYSILRRPASVAIVLFLIVATVFWPAVHHQFVSWDDSYLVYDNPHYTHPGGTDEGFFWRNPYLKLYMPLTYSAWTSLVPFAQLAEPVRLDENAWLTLSPLPFHSLNLALHLVNVLLVFAILLVLVRNTWPAAAGALLFGIHPLQVESVAWVSELKGVLCGSFALAGILCYLNATKSKRTDKLAYCMAFACFVAALLSKPSAAALPAALLALDLLRSQTDWHASVRRLAPFFVLSLGWIALSRWAQPPDPETPLVALWQRPFIAGDALTFYFGRVLWPVHLAINYGRRPDVVLMQPWGYFMWLPAVLLLVWCWRRASVEARAAVALFVIFLLPTLGFIPFIFQGYSTVSDRYVYLAMLGASFGLAHWLSRFPGRTPRFVTIFGLLILATLTSKQNAVWANDFTLFTQAISVNPKNASAYFSLGNAWRAQGAYDSAIYYFQEATRLNPQDYSYQTNTGETLLRLNRVDEALTAFQRAVELKPDAPSARYNLANTLSQSGKLREAEQQFLACLRLDPNFADCYNNLAITLAKQGRRREAISFWQRSLKLHPDNPEAHFNLANALMKEGKTKDAIQHYELVVRLAPDFAPAQAALQRALRGSTTVKRP